jgi:ubiquinone biosynthesis protein COQ4
MKIFSKIAYYFDTVRFLLGMGKIFFNPKDISPIFKVRSFRNHKSLKIALESLHSVKEIHELIEGRYLATEPYNLEELSNYPEGTLGQVYAEHMKKYELQVVFYPAMDSKVDDDINYMRMRARQTHDIHHVVLGFPAKDFGEMCISAFYLAQNKIPLSGFLLGVGFFITMLKQPHRIDELINCIIKGWLAGKKAKYFLGIKWEEYFKTPINEVRKMVGVDVKDEYDPTQADEAKNLLTIIEENKSYKELALK